MSNFRGIQSYIFKTNKVKEIIGASYLVEYLIATGLEDYVNNHRPKDIPRDKYILDWENREKVDFLEDKSVRMEVMFIGGGNAYVLFRKGSECEEVNKFLARYVLHKTYSLNLAVAVIPKTNSYEKDYEEINNKLREIKAKMPATQPVGALPFMDADNITGYPITEYYITDMKTNSGEYLCRESILKRDKAYDKDQNGEYTIPVGEKIFDEMVWEKGKNSTLALVHIDGNSMGIRIKEEMKSVEKYEEAIPKMRKLSQEIGNTFNEVFTAMCQNINDNAAKVKKMSEAKHLWRKIILAGDDITFVCNAKVAIPAVKFFLKELGKKEGGYSACGGIAFFNSHFPFSDAYEVAEACCSSAKKVAKTDSHKANGTVGCYFDFQLCTNVRAAELESYRKKNYENRDGKFIARPYFVARYNENKELMEKNKINSVDELDKWCAKFADENIMPRNKAKGLRNSIPQGRNAREREISFLNSRDIILENPEYNYKVWYDALELMDLYVKEWVENGK